MMDDPIVNYLIFIGVIVLIVGCVIALMVWLSPLVNELSANTAPYALIAAIECERIKRNHESRFKPRYRWSYEKQTWVRRDLTEN